MIDDVGDIQSYYDEAVEKEMVRSDRHQLERDITWRYLDSYLPPEGNVLEIGCGAGTITIGLLERGYKVTAVDFSERMIELCRKRISEENQTKTISS